MLRRLSIGNSLPDCLAKRRSCSSQILRCDDSETDARVNAAACRLINARSMIVVPLHHRESTFGVLKVFSAQPHAFGEQDEQTLHLMAGLMGAALSHAAEFEARQQTLVALQESETRFRSLIESAPDAIVVADSQNRIVSWNSGAQSIFGYTFAEVQGQSLTLLMPDSFHRVAPNGLIDFSGNDEVKANGHGAEVQGRRKDGSKFPMELALANWDSSEGGFFSAIIRDITERKISEQRRLAEHSVTHILVKNAGIEDTARGVLAALCDNLGWDYGGFWLVDNEAKVLRTVHSHYSSQVGTAHLEEVAERTTFAPGVGLLGLVWAQAKPRWIEDVESDPIFMRDGGGCRRSQSRARLPDSFRRSGAWRDRVLQSRQAPCRAGNAAFHGKPGSANRSLHRAQAGRTGLAPKR